MNIVFNMLECGLGNNGGTRTIIKCAEVLENLNHRCDIVATADNFTWFDHKKIISNIPTDTEVVIATAHSTVMSTLRSGAAKKAWYIRAHENWSTSDETLNKLYKSGIINIVNSRGLQQQISACGADSRVIYQGIDFDWWENEELRPENKIKIGCLYTKQSRKRWKDFVRLVGILGTDDYEYLSVGNAHPDEKFLTESWSNVGHARLRHAYSSCHIWFAPTNSEGLHNVPMEANLCGCLVVCADEPLNGMIYDYAFPNNTAMVYDRKDIVHAAKLIGRPNWSLIDNMQQHLIHHIGTREDNMEKLVEVLNDNN